MNKVLLTGRLTRDPEMRALASGKHVTAFSVATNEYVGNGREKAEYHAVIAWVSSIGDRTRPLTTYLVARMNSTRRSRSCAQ